MIIAKTYDTSVKEVVVGGYEPELADSESKVVAYEKVSVPAGTFDACKIVNVWKSENGKSYKESCWWAPAVHFLVRCDKGYPYPYPYLRLEKYTLGNHGAQSMKQ